MTTACVYLNEGIDLFPWVEELYNVKLNTSLNYSVLSMRMQLRVHNIIWIHSNVDANDFEYELELRTVLIEIYAKLYRC